jgi:spore germination protein YaaH
MPAHDATLGGLMAGGRNIRMNVAERSHTSGEGTRPGRAAGAQVLVLAPRDQPTKRSPRPLGAGPKWLMVLGAGVGLVILLLASLQAAPPLPPPIVVVSTPYWNIDHGTSTVLANRPDVSEVSPWMYALDADGDIVNQYGPEQAGSMTTSLAALRRSGLRIVPTVANVSDGDFSYQPIARILHDPELTTKHIAAIVALVEQQNYPGIDIDYENLHSGDRQVFTDFVTQLAEALHAHGRTLSVTLFAKATDAGYDQRNVAQDYAAIGKAADEVRLMGYDYHWASSAPGPIAPVDWIRDVLNYAKSQISPLKIVLGIPMYGYDWVGKKGTPVAWLQAFRLANQYHATMRFDLASQTPWFEYTDPKGQVHHVWFENAASATAKLDVAQGSGIGGVYLWLYGYEDTDVWSALHQTFPVQLPQPAPSSVRGSS